MKQLKTTLLLITLLFPVSAMSHDFEVDGIYYHKKGTEVSVTCKGNSYSSYYNEYSGLVVIPSTVIYNGTTYSVTSIDEEAFRECTGLINVSIPNSITSIGQQAFAGCDSLSNVTVPLNVSEIGFMAFGDCPGLKKFTWNAKRCNCRWLFSNGSYLLEKINIEEVIIGDQVEILPIGFVTGSKIESITIPNSVTKIGEYAFSSCSKLVSVVIPNSITTLERGIFRDCSSLLSISIPNSVNTISDYAFYNCSNLEEVTIPNSVKAINDYAFRCCSSLTEITIPNSVSTFGKYVFLDCTSLTSFTIPDTFTSYNQAFVGCTSLKNLIIPNSFTTIERGEFRGCTGLESIYIPNSVSSIQSGAFENCTSLAEIIIPDSVVTIGDNYASYDGTYIGAFSGCVGLKKVTIGKSLSGTHSGAFSGCIGITELIWNAKNSCSFSNMPKSEIKHVFIGDEVEELPSSFVEGSKIESIMIPNSVNKIGKCAFKDCLYLTNATISNSITSLPESIFANCRKLKTLTIPYPVTSIGKDAFYYCEDLTDVTSLAKTPPVMGNYNGLYPAYQMATLHVPERSVEAYKATDWWNCFLIIEGDASEDGSSDYSDYMKCDTNGDGEVNIADVNKVIDAILNH